MKLENTVVIRRSKMAGHFLRMRRETSAHRAMYNICSRLKRVAQLKYATSNHDYAMKISSSPNT